MYRITVCDGWWVYTSQSSNMVMFACQQDSKLSMIAVLLSILLSLYEYIYIYSWPVCMNAWVHNLHAQIDLLCYYYIYIYIYQPHGSRYITYLSLSLFLLLPRTPPANSPVIILYILLFWQLQIINILLFFAYFSRYYYCYDRCPIFIGRQCIVSKACLQCIHIKNEKYIFCFTRMIINMIRVLLCVCMCCVYVLVRIKLISMWMEKIWKIAQRNNNRQQQNDERKKMMMKCPINFGGTS